jgi:hypothetical protein
MTIQDLGNVGELIAAIATVATLIYLARQIRQSTSTVATSTYESVFTGYNDLNLAVASDPDLNRILDTGLSDPGSLDKNEQVRFVLIISTFSNHYLKLLRLKERGAFPEEEWRTYGREAAQVYRTPGGALFRSAHPNYGDLYRATDSLEVAEVLDLHLAEPLEKNEGGGTGTAV